MNKIKLYKEQRDAVDKAAPLSFFALFMNMGTGKTYTALGILDEWIKRDKIKGPKVLILCPKAVINGWLTSIDNFGITADVYVVNPQKWIRQPVELNKFDYIIIDEAHGMKNATSRLYKRAKNMTAKRKLILTGTPTDGKPQELLALSNLLSTDIIGEYWDIAKKSEYFELDPMYKSIRYARKKTFPYFIECFKPYMYVLDKLTEVTLPKLTEVHYNITMKPKQQKLYDDAKDMLYTNHLGKNKGIHSKGVQVAKLRGIQSGFLTDEYGKTRTFKHNKLKALDAVYNSFKDNKLIVFVSYTREVNDIVKWCEDNELDYRELTGKTNNTPAYIEELELFNYDVLIVHYKSGGAGLNLTACTNTCLYSLPLSSIDYAQSIKRTHRTGQTKDCTIHIIMTKKSYDIKTYNKLNKKLKDGNIDGT